MPRQLRSLVRWSLSAALLTSAFFATSAFAQAAMDPVTVTVLRSTTTHVYVTLTAGPSGTPGGVYLEWMTQAAFDAYGGWPPDPYDPSLYYCEFTGDPTYKVYGAGTYMLGPNESVDVVLGALFDETGVLTDYTSEMPASTAFVLRARAEGFGTTMEGPMSASSNCVTKDPHPCIHTQEYWRTHSSSWLVTSLKLGNVTYTKAQLLTILNKNANGNGLLILAHQLIATKLNIANGAASATIAATVAAADAKIGNLVAPPVGSGSLASKSVNSLADTMDDWNEGENRSVGCGVTPTLNSSWGRIKAIYR